MSDTMLAQLAALKTMPMPALKQRWRDLCETQPLTAGEALAAAAQAGKRGGALNEARDFLQAELAAGPRPANEIEELAGEIGIAQRTL